LTAVDVTAQGLAASVRELVTLPEVALRVARMVEDPDASAADIGRVISQDAALASRVLRVANSPAYGQYGKIATISRAIAVLGVRRVRDLTMGLTAIRSFDGIGNELVSMESFWRRSVLCAVAAGRIAARGERKGNDGSFVAGLLHDIGHLVMFNRIPDLAREALLMCVDSTSDLDLHLCERELLGFDHGTVGGTLAHNWGLPSALQECIEFHHEPGKAKVHPLEVAIVHIANSIAALAEIDSSELTDAPVISESALRSARMTSGDVIELVAETQTAAEDMLPLLMAA